jgi:hypothetical protein
MAELRLEYERTFYRAIEGSVTLWDVRLRDYGSLGAIHPAFLEDEGWSFISMPGLRLGADILAEIASFMQQLKDIDTKPRTCISCGQEKPLSPSGECSSCSY